MGRIASSTPTRRAATVEVVLIVEAQVLDTASDSH